MFITKIPEKIPRFVQFGPRIGDRPTAVLTDLCPALRNPWIPKVYIIFESHRKRNEYNSEIFTENKGLFRIIFSYYQPSIANMTSNHITKVAIVGVRVTSYIYSHFKYLLTTIQAGGNSGIFMTEALLRTGKHTITALVRAGSQNKLPDGVIPKQIDYSRPETLVEALQGQDALVITLSGGTPHEIDLALVNAAGEAGVPWILPNEWGPDSANKDLIKDIPIFQPKGE